MILTGYYPSEVLIRRIDCVYSPLVKELQPSEADFIPFNIDQCIEVRDRSHDLFGISAHSFRCCRMRSTTFCLPALLIFLLTFQVAAFGMHSLGFSIIAQTHPALTIFTSPNSMFTNYGHIELEPHDR